MKKYFFWVMVAATGISLAIWQSGARSFPDSSHNRISQPRKEVEKPETIQSVADTGENESSEPVASAGSLLQASLDRLSRIPPPVGKAGDQSATSGADGMNTVSPQAMAEYEARKAQVEREEIQRLLDLLSTTQGAAKQEVITALWRYAAKIGVPEEALVALDLASRDANEDVARLAARALADLRRFKDRLENGPSAEELALQPPQPPASPDQTGASAGENVAVDNAGYQARLAEYEAAVTQREAAAVQSLTEKLYTAKDDEAYNEALHALSLHRSDASVDAWLGLVNNENFNVREEAVQNLWRSAANGLDQGGRITTALQGAAGDSDKDVAAVAQQALTDLENFKRRQAQVAAAPPVVQSAPAGGNSGNASSMSGTAP